MVVFQSALFVGIFSQRIRPTLIQNIGDMVPGIGPPTASWLSEKIDMFIEKLSGGASEGPAGLRKYLPMLWGAMITGMVLLFVKSSLETFAQQYVKDLKKAKAKKDGAPQKATKAE